MKRLLLVILLVLAAPAAALAQESSVAQQPSSATATPTYGIVPQVGVTPTPIVINQPVPASFSAGTLSSEILNWLAVVFGAPIASFLVLWLRALAKKAGIEVSQEASDKLQDMLKRGIQDQAAKAGADLEGKMTIEIQNKILAGAVGYAKTHGADTIKDLSTSDGSLAFLKKFDPNDVKVQEALAARATAALNEITPEQVIGAQPAGAS